MNWVYFFELILDLISCFLISLSVEFSKSLNLLIKSSSLSFVNKKPPSPWFKISLGPFLQLLAIIGILRNDASSNTNPGSSHLEDKIKHFALLIYLYAFSLKPIKNTLSSKWNFFINNSKFSLSSPSPKITKLYSGLSIFIL